jgi:hypothetical protein
MHVADVKRITVDDLVFEDYWPDDVRDLVREFLTGPYDPETMPPLIIESSGDGRPALIGWLAEPGEPGLLEAVRGWARAREMNASSVTATT